MVPGKLLFFGAMVPGKLRFFSLKIEETYNGYLSSVPAESAVHQIWGAILTVD